MVAAVADRAAVLWMDVRCSNPRCRALLTRYRVLPGAPHRPVIVQEMVCPDRRCRKAQTVHLPPRDDVLP